MEYSFLITGRYYFGTITQATNTSTWLLFGRIVELYADWAKQEGLSYNKLAVIMTIFYGEKATQREICSEWALPKQTVSTICKGFEQTGLITYTAGTEDNREKYMALTAKGLATYRPVMEKLQAVEFYALQKMGDEKVALMLACMEQFTSAFAEGAKEVTK